MPGGSVGSASSSLSPVNLPQFYRSAEHLSSLGGRHPGEPLEPLGGHAVEVDQPTVVVLADEIRAAHVHRAGKVGSRLTRSRYCCRRSRRVSSSAVPANTGDGLRFFTAMTAPATMQANARKAPVSDAGPVGVPPESVGLAPIMRMPAERRPPGPPR